MLNVDEYHVNKGRSNGFLLSFSFHERAAIGTRNNGIDTTFQSVQEIELVGKVSSKQKSDSQKGK